MSELVVHVVKKINQLQHKYKLLNTLLKDKSTHNSHSVDQGTCSCGKMYIREAMDNLEIQINEHSNNTACAQLRTMHAAHHLCLNKYHTFHWKGNGILHNHVKLSWVF